MLDCVAVEPSEDHIADGSAWRRLAAELVGTFFLTFVAAGGHVFAAVSAGAVDRAAIVVAPALLVMAMIYTLANISGAHFNPAVTLAFAARGDFPWRRVGSYWLAQLAGAIGAAAGLRAMFGLAGHLGTTRIGVGVGEVPALAVEALFTCLLITVILGTARGTSIVGHNAALAVGGVIALAGLIAEPVSGASLNPARSLGPALVSGQFDNWWLYVVGPCAGVILAIGVVAVVQGGRDANEKRSARGHGA